METVTKKSTTIITYLSTLCQYLVPFGGFIFPLLIWSSNKKSIKNIYKSNINQKMNSKNRKEL